ncbi:pyridoxal kinase [Myroides sp. LJL116]
MQQNSIISIQSLVSYGYVGNSIASFAIRLHGIEVVILPTVLLSTHAEDNVYYGEVITPELFSLLIKGVKEIDLCQKSKYLITGYINTKELIDISSSFIKYYKQVNPTALYVYDPVFGDTRANGLYIEEDVAHYSLDHLLELADIITPNHFEIEFILQRKISTQKDLQQSVLSHALLKEKTIVLTGAVLEDTPEDILEVIVVRQGEVYRFKTSFVHLQAVGTGDLFASVLTSQLHQGKDILQATEKAVDFVTQVLLNVQKNNELQLSSKAIMQSLSFLD